MIRTLIVDDEPLARHGLRVHLGSQPDVEIIGEAADGPAAVEAIRTLTPDLVFLDVQLPGCDGFEVLERIGDTGLPMVVFVTAHDDRALRAFEIHALDYLLKPYTEARLLESLRRARAELAMPEEHPERERLLHLLEALDAGRAVPVTGHGSTWPRRFTVRDRERIILVRVDELEAVEAAGNYVQLVTRGRRHLMRQTLMEMESQLDPARFVRIHRSTIVNVDCVREIRPDPHGDADVVLESGARYRLSRAYRIRLLPES